MGNIPEYKMTPAFKVALTMFKANIAIKRFRIKLDRLRLEARKVLDAK